MLLINSWHCYFNCCYDQCCCCCGCCCRRSPSPDAQLSWNHLLHTCLPVSQSLSLPISLVAPLAPLEKSQWDLSNLWSICIRSTSISDLFMTSFQSSILHTFKVVVVVSSWCWYCDRPALHFYIESARESERVRERESGRCRRHLSGRLQGL